jgi:hypothetical protein
VKIEDFTCELVCKFVLASSVPEDEDVTETLAVWEPGDVVGGDTVVTVAE